MLIRSDAVAFVVSQHILKACERVLESASAGDMDADDFPEGQLTFEQALELGDLQLCFPDGRKLFAHRTQLMLASPVLRGMLAALWQQRKRPREDVDASENPIILPVDEDLEAWMDVLRMLYQGVVNTQPAQPTLAAALRVLPIAHKYDMQQLLSSCLELLRSQAKVPALELLQWLSVGSTLQYQPLTSLCLDRIRSSWTGTTWRDAMCCESCKGILQGMPPGTVVDLMTMSCGVRPRLQGLNCPDMSKPCRFSTKLVPGEYTGLGTCCMAGSQLIYGQPRGKISIFDLDTQSHEGLLEAPNHVSQRADEIVQSLCCSADGSTVVSADMSRNIWIWDLPSKSLRMCIDDNTDPISDITIWGADKALLAMHGPGVQVRDLSTGTICMSIDCGEGSSVEHITTSSGSVPMAVCGNSDGTVRLLDLRDGSCARTMQGHNGWVQAVAMDMHGRTALSGGFDTLLKHWDLGSGACIKTLGAAEGCDRVCELLMDPHGTTALTTEFQHSEESAYERSNTVTVWDITGGALRARHTQGFQRSVAGICGSPELGTVAVLWKQAGEGLGISVW